MAEKVISVDRALKQLVAALTSLEDKGSNRDDKQVWVTLHTLHMATHHKAGAPSPKAVAKALADISHWIQNTTMLDDFTVCLMQVLDAIAVSIEHRDKLPKWTT